MNFLRKILVPIVPIYFLVTWLRNRLYDWGVKKSTSFSTPVICVGNLSVGGTGKTPMIEYLIHLLKDKYNIATLSRGYKRKTKGFVLASDSCTTDDIGDEPFQFYNKFNDSIKVAVDANRVGGVTELLKLTDTPEIVLLDDAFQHRKVRAGLNILLTTYANPFFNDIVLPTGNLREPKSGYKRADIIVVTKCPEHISEIKKVKYIERINAKNGQHVFFSKIVYADTVVSKHATKRLKELQDFTLVTGIANATPLVNFLKSEGLNFKHLNFTDHYDFTAQDIKDFETQNTILTTEKDYMRLKQFKSLENKLFYLPITMKISDNEKFDKLINNFVEVF